MRKGKNYAAVIAAGYLMVIWISLKIAPFTSEGLLSVLQNMGIALNGHPFKFNICEETSNTVLVMTIVYLIAIVYFFATLKNKRPGEEYGSAKWGDVKALQKSYLQDESTDRILSDGLRLGMDMYKHQRNLFSLIVGGAGSAKTRGYVIPNILQCNGSMVILDPKGENLRATGNVLKEKGYVLKILDLIHMNLSDRYNPFRYFTDENDIQRTATILFKATGSKEAKPTDPYWENAAMELLMAIMLYLYYEAPEYEQNFGMLMDMVRLVASDSNDDEEDEQSVNPIEMLFRELRIRKPEHPALKYYADLIGLPNKTLQTIKSTLTAKLSKFNISDLISLTNTDDLEFEKIGEQKMAIFCVIPDMDSSFNFLVSTLYMQMFQKLTYIADNVYHGMLPVHVHFIMEEFANVALPDDFDHVVSVIRSRNVSFSIILQNMNQIKALFKDTWESIVGNCDSFIYLGGNEQSTHKYVSELLDKETLDTNTYGKTHGIKGNYSTNDQKAGRELMQPGEVRRMSRRKCIVLISGEAPVMDYKYNLQKHPLIHKTPLAKRGKKGLPFEYGKVTHSMAGMGLVGYMNPEDVAPEELFVSDMNCTVLTEDDYEKIA